MSDSIIQCASRDGSQLLAAEGSLISMSIENRFDIPFIAAMALKEKQVQQNYRPIIAVHKWFARRPGSLFRGLILSEFSERPLSEAYFSSNDFPNRVIADPFMGGGTPLIEANRIGFDIQGYDINPMAAWIVQEEIKHIDLQEYHHSADALVQELQSSVGRAYLTDCPMFGDQDVPVKYFLWVKTLECERCGTQVDLFPGYLVADNTRHPQYVLVCSQCGQLNEVNGLEQPGHCRDCGKPLSEEGPAKRCRCACSQCGHVNTYPRPSGGPLQHRMFAIEYFNPFRHNEHRGRFFKRPDEKDLKCYRAVADSWSKMSPEFVPRQEILAGDETDRLHRWGYRHYRELYNERQLHGLELSCRYIAALKNERIRHALATNLSDLLRYQNMLCRYDTMALKSLDVFSIHGFPVGLVQCESNIIGITNGKGVNVGSGGWLNIIEKYSRAKRYCSQPFEVAVKGSKKAVIQIQGEWIGDYLNGLKSRKVGIRCVSSTSLELPPNSIDAVFTDPPYFGNVQYGELMDFCYVWLRQLVGHSAEGFDRESTRSDDELTGNETKSRGIEQFTAGLSGVYSCMARALKPGGPLAFTFHHNRIEVYYSVGVAILDAGLHCYATLPSPAEMGGSIHIRGTGSSIVDTVFVCRSRGTTRKGQAFSSLEELSQIVQKELSELITAGMRPTSGDVRCIVFGHVARMTVQRLAKKWNAALPTTRKLSVFREEAESFGDLQSLVASLTDKTKHVLPKRWTSGSLFNED